MAARPESPALAAHDLACERGGRRLFAALSFALAAGEALVLEGPNGSGKSSLLRLLAGLLRPVAGRVLWHGLDTREEPGPWRRALVFLGHRDAVKPAMTVAANLRFWHAFEGGGGSVGAALEALGLAPLAALPAALLSAGQRRRLALARLALRPGGCWLLDEPGAGLDAPSAALLAALIERHLALGGVVAMAGRQAPAPAGAARLALPPPAQRGSRHEESVAPRAAWQLP